MRRPIRIALKAVAIYAAVSLTVAIVMAEMTLHPWRRPLPDKDKERIAHIYAQYGANLQPVIINAADGAELQAWYSVPIHDNGNAVILLHGIGDNRTANRVVRSRPMACARVMTSIAGSRGYTNAAQLVLMASENRWVLHWCWKAWGRSPGFAQLSRILHSPPSGAWPTIVRDTSWELAG